MAAPHVCILQTSFAKREDTVAFLKEKVPGVRVEFITDSTLLTDVRANGGPSQAVIDRMTLYAKAAEISGADLIVNSCSTVGEVADIYAKEVNVPVMKIDLPMAQEAVRLGTKIALIATLETTLGPSQRLIEKVGAEQGKKMECTQYLQNPAWDALQAGHPEEHNRILMESIRELDIRAKHHVNVIAVRGPEGVLDVAPGGDYRLVQGGRIVVLGRTEYMNLLRRL